ncbi:MAG: PQQ-binding-like beta-propeller repeat protein, partial [Thermoplasmatota archaeon]
MFLLVIADGLVGVNGEWVQKYGDLYNSNCSESTNDHHEGLVNWRFETEKEIRSVPVFLPDGRLVFCGTARDLYCVDRNGFPSWSVNLGWDYHYRVDSLHPSLAVLKDGNIILGNSLWIDSYDTNGIRQWTDKEYSVNPNTGIKIDDQERMYFSNKSKLVCIDRDRKLLSSTELGNFSYSTPAIMNNGTIITTDRTGNVYSVYPNGSIKWKVDLDTRIYSSPVIFDRTRILIPTTDENESGRLFMFDDIGQEIWNISFVSPIISSPSYDKNGNIFIGCFDRNVYCISGSGEEVWSFATGCHEITTPLIDGAGNIIFVSGEDEWEGYCYSLDTYGKMNWKVRVDGSSPGMTIDEKGIIYFGTKGGTFYSMIGDDRIVPRKLLGFRTYDHVDGIYLTWKNTNIDGGPAVDKIRIYRSFNGNEFVNVYYVDGHAEEFFDEDVVDGITYGYYLEPVNNYGSGEITDIRWGELKEVYESDEEERCGPLCI